MAKGKRPIIIAGNWKMYKTIEEAEKFVHDLDAKVKEVPAQIYLAVPFTVIKPAAQAAATTAIVIGAQNMNDASEGAFTGEIAGKMVVNAGAKFVLLGHSERRHLFKEDNGFIQKKMMRAHAVGLQPILCVGETKQEREEGQAEAVVEKQLTECLMGLQEEELKKSLVAYEPVWAIGTGLTATPEEAQAMHSFCRAILKKIAGARIGGKMPILYGGSVRPDNAEALLQQEDIDGLLVGGASLSIETFSQIIACTKPGEQP